MAYVYNVHTRGLKLSPSTRKTKQSAGERMKKRVSVVNVRWDAKWRYGQSANTRSAQ